MVAILVSIKLSKSLETEVKPTLSVASEGQLEMLSVFIADNLNESLQSDDLIGLFRGIRVKMSSSVTDLNQFH